MKNLKHIEDVLYEPIKALEELRIKSLPKVRKMNQMKIIQLIVFGTGCLCILISTIVIPNSEGKNLYWLLAFPLGLILIFSSVVFNNYFYEKKKTVVEETKELYKKKVRQQIIEPLIQIIAPEFNYLPDEGFSSMDLAYMDLYHLDVIKLYSEDLFKGKIGLTHPIEFGEVFLNSSGHGDSKDPKNILSHGLVFKVNLELNYQPMAIFSKAFKQIVKKENGLILVYPRQHNHFHYYIKKKEFLNQIPFEFLSYLNKIKKERNMEFIFKIRNNFLYLAIHWNYNLFNPKLKESLLHTDTLLKNKNEQILDSHIHFSTTTNSAINKFYDDLNLCLEIIHELELLIPNLTKL